MVRKLKRVVIAGGSGSIGGHLVRGLADLGYTSVILSRSGRTVPGAVRATKWLGDDRSWHSELESAVAVVNLSGESIAQRWTPGAKERIRSSRIESARAIGEAMRGLEAPPYWLNASAIGYYGDAGETPCYESSPSGTGFLAETCRDWELAATDSCPSNGRLGIARLGNVLERDAGYLPQLAKLSKRGMFGKIGKGLQWISWIHVADLVNALTWMIEAQAVGTYNLVSPGAIRQRELSSLLAEKVGAFFNPPVPAGLVRLGASFMGIDASLVLDGANVVPGELARARFEFEFPAIQSALADLLG